MKNINNLRIGFSHLDPRWGSFFWSIVGHCAEQEAALLGITLFRIYASDAAEQIAGLKHLLEKQQIDALMMAPLDIRDPELIAFVAQTVEAGIPVVTLDSKIDGPIASTIGTDDVKGQELAAEYICQRLKGKGKIVYLVGDLGMQAAQLRREGVQRVLQRYPDIELVFEAEGRFRRDTGAQLTREALAAHPDIQAVIAGNDHMAFGAIDAIEESGRTGTILVSGYDALPEALLMIQAGQLTASVGRATRDMVRQSFALTIKAQQGITVPPLVLADVNLVTPENLQTAAFDSLSLLPGVLHNLSEGNEALRLILQTTAEVSQIASSGLDPEALIQKSIDLIYDRFRLYFSGLQIYLLDETSGRLEFASAAGKGKEAKPGRSIDLNHLTSPIARAAYTRKEVIVTRGPRVTDVIRHRETGVSSKSEMAIPLKVGDKLLGVLSATSEEKNRFNHDVLQVMTSLADQISVAIQNARLLAEQRRLTDELRALDRLKSQFLANMSHELRTPLNSILNFTEFVASGTFGTVNTRQADALTKVVNSGEHLLSLVNDILDLTKIESGMMELFIEDVDLNELMEDVLSVAQGLLLSKPVEFVVDVQTRLPHLPVDRRRVRQILFNLLSNAIKFTAEGSITVRAGVEADELLFAISDTGPGIAAEDQSLIFEPFRQSKHGLQQNSGTGLGLPICRHLAQAHHGRLWLESRVGIGSTFFVTLPLPVEQQSEEFINSSEEEN